MYKNILVALDFSEDNKVLIKKADTLSLKYGAKLHFINVSVDYNEMYSGLIDIDCDYLMSEQEKERKAVFEEWRKELKVDVGEILLLRGDVVEEIKNVSDKLNIDLLVVGKHQDFWSKMFSYSKKIIQNTKADVLVVPIID